MSKEISSEISNLHLFIQRTVDYKFKNKELLLEAFTHKSECDTNYERLELLGDAIIRLVITHYLYSQYENASEGSLSREIQTIISKDMLAEISLRLGLVNFVRSKNIRLDDDNLKRSISTDLFESLIGAIFLDSNYKSVENIVIKLLQKNLQIKEKIGEKDPKTLLQEYCQARKIDLPVYKTSKLNKVDHNPRFLVTCELISHNLRAESGCSNVQTGQKNTASTILEKLKRYEKHKNYHYRSE